MNTVLPAIFMTIMDQIRGDIYLITKLVPTYEHSETLASLFTEINHENKTTNLHSCESRDHLRATVCMQSLGHQNMAKYDGKNI